MLAARRMVGMPVRLRGVGKTLGGGRWTGLRQAGEQRVAGMEATRWRTMRVMSSLEGRAREKVEEAREKVEETMEETKEKVEETKEKVEEKVGEAKEKLGEIKQKMGEKVEEAKDAMGEKAEAATEKAGEKIQEAVKEGTGRGGEERAGEEELGEVMSRSSGGSGLQYWLRGYASLSKARLGALVLSTAMFGYFMAPAPFLLSSFAACSVGTAGTIMAANSLNQVLEVENDRRMLRTKKRWLPSAKMTRGHALAFAGTCGLGGSALLYATLGPLPAALAAGNVLLYAGVYTPLKQRGPSNTWVGAVVGAVPPLIGYAACAGGLDAGAAVAAGLLGLWQMPHFMALSYNLRQDYAAGGFRMLINTQPEQVPGVVMRYSLAMLLLGPAAYAADMCTLPFVADSMLPSAYLVYLAKRFQDQPGKETSRAVFKYSLLLLPVLMGLMMLHRKPLEDRQQLQVAE